MDYKVIRNMGLALVLGIALGIIVLGRSLGPGSREASDKRNAERIFKELHLSQEQIQSLLMNRANQMDSMKESMDSLQANWRALKNELEKNVTDREKILRLASEMKSIQGTMVDMRIKSILEVRQVMTPEQFAQFQEKMRVSVPKGPPPGKAKGRMPPPPERMEDF